MTQGICRLCQQQATLCESHILPAFVCRWLKETTPGWIRSTVKPNLRIQDGLKEDWLCQFCEQRLAAWESRFAEEAFGPFHEKGVGEVKIPYGRWALKFAASVSWRVLTFFRDRGLQYLSAQDRERTDRAAAAWADFILERRKHPGEFEQHIVHLDVPSEIRGIDISPYLSRYLLRSWDLDVITSSEACVTYAKLCRVVIFGFIRVQRPRDWTGTKLHLRQGVLDGSNCRLPGFLPNYWNDRADQIGESFGALSSRQRSKIASVFSSTPVEVLAQSEAFRAMVADVGFSGDAAFSRRENRDGDEFEPGG